MIDESFSLASLNAASSTTADNDRVPFLNKPLRHGIPYAASATRDQNFVAR
jgi:hypothetical protein